MNVGRLRALRWSVAVAGVVAMALSALGLSLAFADPSLIRTDEVTMVAEQMGLPVQVLMVLGLVVPMVGSAATAILIFVRRPQDPMALTFALMLITLTAFSTRGLVALSSYEAAARPLTFGVSAIGLSSFVYVFLSFPSGRLSRSSAVLWLGATAFIASRPSAIDSLIQLRAAAETTLADRLYVGGFALMFLVCGGVQVLRFKQGTVLERLQIKWIVFPIVGIGVYVTLTLLVPSLFIELSPMWFGAALAGAIPFSVVLPICIGRGVLKYRLYDIDVVIKRTLLYGVLTAILVGTYLISVIALQALLGPITSESDLAVAASTLTVAALFRPLRARVQGFLDRRFFRSRYDAHRTLEHFTARLRDQVDLERLNADLCGVVREAMQPDHVSVWLRAART